jgi:Family of unknown function (DUF6186)
MTRTLTLVGYVAIAVAVVTYELRARRRGTATIDDALTVVLRSRIGRALVLFSWLWLGWHLFVRVGDR